MRAAWGCVARPVWGRVPWALPEARALPGCAVWVARALPVCVVWVARVLPVCAVSVVVRVVPVARALLV